MGSVVCKKISHPWTCAVASSGAGHGEEGQEENQVQRLSPPAFLAIVQNRELQIMKMLDHGNVTTLHHYFYTEGEKVRRCAARALFCLSRPRLSRPHLSRAPTPPRPTLIVLTGSFLCITARRDLLEPRDGFHPSDRVRHVAALREGQEDFPVAVHEGLG